MSYRAMFSKRSLAVAAVLFALWAVVANSYYGPAKPLTKVEIDSYMQTFEKLLIANVVLPEGVGMEASGLQDAIADMRAFAERDNGKPIYMVNLMKWRRGELAFPQGVVPGVIKTAQDADLAYNKALFGTLLANYSHTAYLSSAEGNAFNYGAATSLDNWGEIGIFRYRSRRDFLNMVTSDSYNNILYLKLVSMGVVVVSPTQPHGLLFNPMPNIPVLLFFLFTIGFLIYRLMAIQRKLRE